MKKSLKLLIPLMLVFSCTKQEIVTVTGNNPPADNSVSDITVSNYVNRLYINLLARKASTAEFDSAFAKIKADPHSVAVREGLVNELISDPYYRLNITQRSRNDYIEGVDTAMMKRDLVTYYGLYNDPQYAVFKEKLGQDIINLQQLILLNDKFLGDSINTIGVHKICINNIYYDQVNMGTENFVVSMFQHFLDRYPTGSELASAKLMVDGVSSSVFLQTGDSKDDFIKIFFESDSYFEGQVYILFKQYLYRNPTQAEALTLSKEYKKTQDYGALQRAILTTDEFFNQ